jgi:hypothetical protein
LAKLPRIVTILPNAYNICHCLAFAATLFAVRYCIGQAPRKADNVGAGA